MRIVYDHEYNFHQGYHGEIVKTTTPTISWVKGHISNHFEGAVRSSVPSVRGTLTNVGSMISQTGNYDLCFSPHVLLTEQETPYIMDLEDIYWLFGDTYEEVSLSKHIAKWKINMFQSEISDKSLVHILWWSHSAIDRFNQFCKKYKILPSIREKIMKNSTVLYPTAPIINKIRRPSTTRSFVAVFNKRNYQRKGGDIILDTFVKLYKKGLRNWTLDIYGGLPDAEEGFLPENISVHKPVSREDLQLKFAEKDVFLFASRADTFGTVLVEAMNTGIYIVATAGEATFASKEILDFYPNKTLILSKHNNGVFDVIDKLAFSLKIEELIHKQSKLHQWKSPFTRSRTRKQFLKVVSSI